jgi:hypothetical protein
MAEYLYHRGDTFAMTCPITKDLVPFDLTSGGPWTATATLGQLDVVKAITEAPDPLKTTLVVQNGNGFATVVIYGSELLNAGFYDLELTATDGTLRHTWPKWVIWIVEPQRI